MQSSFPPGILAVTCAWNIFFKSPLALFLTSFSSELKQEAAPEVLLKTFPSISHLHSVHCTLFHFLSSVQFSRSVVSSSLRPHESQHSRPPCPSPTPEFTQTHVHRVCDAFQPFHPLSSPSPPSPNPSQHQGLSQ